MNKRWTINGSLMFDFASHLPGLRPDAVKDVWLHRAKSYIVCAFCTS